MVTVSESLKKGVDNFLELTPRFSAHMENCENPHEVTAAQVGLGSLKNEEQATKEEFIKEQEKNNLHIQSRENPHEVTKSQVGLSNVKNEEQATKEEFLLHAENCENPHGVTAEQIGLGSLKNEEQATKEEFLLHAENAENPHAVTKSQIGLSEVTNEKQASLVQYLQHISGEGDRHSGSDIYYSDSKTINEKIEELIIEGGSGTMYHDELLNREEEGAHSISAISGLRAELDSIEGSISSISHENLSGKDKEGQHPISAISGLSQKLDEVLIFTCITDDGMTHTLVPCVESEFLDSNGYITLPAGTCATIEMIITGAREQNGIIADRNIVSFEVKGMVAKINTAFVQSLSETVTREKQTESGGEMLYKFTYTGNQSKRLAVTGAEGHRVFWRAEVRLKNIVRVSAE